MLVNSTLSKPTHTIPPDLRISLKDSETQLVSDQHSKDLWIISPFTELVGDLPRQRTLTVWFAVLRKTWTVRILYGVLTVALEYGRAPSHPRHCPTGIFLKVYRDGCYLCQGLTFSDYELLRSPLWVLRSSSESECV